ncbi:phage tail tape measure protein [Basfia succiniciproducens]|uniref:phage tail tape measure protein n=1 Tax=Basfia succiniciproducens TaxID=653940 RepID=UPI003FCD62EF
MSGLGSLDISLRLDTAQFNQALNKSTYQTQKFARQFEVNFTNAQSRAKQFSERTTQYLNNIEKAANSINRTANINLFSNIAGFAGTHLQSAALQTLQYADSYTELQNRMRLVTDSQFAMAAATDTVFDISLRTNQAVSATAEVYQRFAKNADVLKISQAEVAELTETVSKAVAMSGASAASADAALMQFGQAMAAGELRGQELNSVMEQTPALAQAIADGLGVPVGALKEMGKSGELSISKVVDALQKVKSSVDTDFDKRVKTLSMSFTNLETSMIQFVGEADSTLGATQKLAEGVEFVANHLEELITVAGMLAGALAVGQISKYSAALLQTGYNSAKNTLAHTREAQSILAKATAMRTAAQVEMASLTAQLRLAQSEQTRYALRERMKVQSAQIIALAQAEATAKRNLATATNLATLAAKGLQGVMSLLGGPVGVVTIAATSLMFFSAQAESARQWALDTSIANQGLAESYDQISESALALKITDQLDNIKKYYVEIEKIKASIATKQIGTDFDGFQAGGGIDDAELEKLQNKIQAIKENAETAKQALENMLKPLGEKMLKSGKSIDEVRKKFELLGADAETVESVISSLPTSFDKTADSATTATEATIDFDKAIKSLNERSQTMQQRLEVLTLKSQGHAKASFVLAGLYEALGASGAEYSKVLNAIANGDVAAAKSAATAINLSAQQLQTMLDMGKQLDAMFETDRKIKKQEQASKPKKTGKKGAGTDYQKQYTDQLTEMQQRLAELNANAEDIRLFGQPSQYQEVNKLTQDIAANAEKYKNYGAEGVEKLKSLAEQIDSANQKVSIAQFGYDNNQRLDAMQFELDLMGKTAEQQEILNYNHQLDLEAARLKVGMTKENIALLDAEIAKLKERRAEIEKQAAERRGSAIAGVKDGMAQIQSDVENVAGNISDITVSAFDGMSDAITDLVTTGKADFKSLATSIIADITNMIVKMMLFNSIKQGMSAMGFGFADGGYVGGYAKGGLVGFADGGFTGFGGKYAPAGVVHRGEYVLTKEATSRIGLDYLNYLNYGTTRGFAGGGAVGQVMSAGYTRSLPNNSGSGNISVKVINNGEPAEAKVSRKQQNGQTEITVELIRQISRGEANQLIQNNFRAGGAFA